MFTFSNLGKYGRLGNQLFQIAATIGLATKHGQDYGFKSWQYAQYFKHFADLQGNYHFQHVGEPTYRYSNLVINTNYPIDLMGFFQSEKYFAHCKADVKFWFDFEETFINKIIARWHHYLSKKPIALHVRRGDYVNLKDYAELKPLYYQLAVNQFEPDIPVMVFSDDIEWCKENLHLNRQVCFVEGQSDIEDLATMSLCKHFVIANSTFSWWAAWLGEKKGSIVLAPPVWYSQKAPKELDSSDIIPQRWTVFKPTKTGIPTKKIDLTDLTFTIPVQYDHPERAENLQLVLDYLQYHFDTQILVYETGMSQLFSALRNREGVDYKFVPSRVFHRTKLLNLMAIATSTPFVANWDADIIISPEHIVQAVEMLRAGKEMVYPYDGTFHRVNRRHIKAIRANMSTQPLKNLDYPQAEFDTCSYGGAVMWQLEKFIEIGGENENFVSYGPEDYERYYRAEKLGVKIDRVVGPLYHINHYVGENSNAQHKHFEQNVAEFEKVKQMSASELKMYIKPQTTNHKQPQGLEQIGFDQTYVVNLDSRPDRWAWAQKQLDNIGFKKYIRWPAIDGKKAGLKSLNKRLTPGMLGCFQSHLNIYKDAMDNGYECIMVFEDDIQPIDGFEVLLKTALKYMPEDWDMIFWGYGERGPFGSYKKMVNNYWVVPGCPWGTQAYMVRGLTNIKYLYERLQPINMQIDEKLANVIFRENRLKYYGVFPSMFPQNMQDFESDVQTPRDNKVTITKETYG